MSINKFVKIIAQELKIQPLQVTSSIKLFDEQNTVPFVARYRKEATGGLDEIQLRAILERLTYLRKLEERKETILHSIEEQGKLTKKLRRQIEAEMTVQGLEDLYMPYKPKRRTRATIARERGLEPLAQMMLEQKQTTGNLNQIAKTFINDDVPTAADALAGACDIIADIVNDDANIRAVVRSRTGKKGLLVSKLADASKDEHSLYEIYYNYQERLNSVPPHRLLAVNRGAKVGVLKIKIEAPDDELVEYIQSRMITNPRSIFRDYIRQAAADGYKRLMSPSIKNDLRNELTSSSDLHAIDTFATNLRQLLLQPPITGQTVIGIDPGYRSGCKVALVDPTGKFLDGAVIYPHSPQKQWDKAIDVLAAFILKKGANLLAVGNGTASRETEKLAATVVAKVNKQLAHNKSTAYVIVSEAGASVYSASTLARKELPTLDVSMRGAVSIARRLQDPMAELVKIDPKAIGVGLYQHDVNQKQLTQMLDEVTESAVNHVGVDVNTASAVLLGYVAGVSRRVAEAVVKYREEHGRFQTRQQLKKVAGVGNKTYQQAAGFLKIPAGSQPLDNSFIHPESYPVVKRLFKYLNLRGDEDDLPSKIEKLRRQKNLSDIANRLDTGQLTLADILESLSKPGRDPRDDLPKPLLRQDVLKMKDLKEGMILSGTVRNIVDFGAFIDIGVGRDGLLHISQLADRHIKSPFELVSIGDVVKVRVTDIDIDKERIGLSMLGVGQ